MHSGVHSCIATEVHRPPIHLQGLPAPLRCYLLLLLSDSGHIYSVLLGSLDADSLAGYMLSLLPSLALAAFAYLAENVLIQDNSTSTADDIVDEPTALHSNTKKINSDKKDYCTLDSEKELRQYAAQI